MQDFQKLALSSSLCFETIKYIKKRISVCQQAIFNMFFYQTKIDFYLSCKVNARFLPSQCLICFSDKINEQDSGASRNCFSPLKREWAARRKHTRCKESVLRLTVVVACVGESFLRDTPGRRRTVYRKEAVQESTRSKLKQKLTLQQETFREDNVISGCMPHVLRLLYTFLSSNSIADFVKRLVVQVQLSITQGHKSFAWPSFHTIHTP